MDAKEQQEGEKRVRQYLITPLEDLGLGRPTTTNKAQFERMKEKTCQGLAWMTKADLEELCGWCQLHPGGPRRDRFPIGNVILQEAQKYRGPQSGRSPSPLFRNVFADQLGEEAIRVGWAPELLKWLRALPFGKREWPGRWTVSQLKKDADDAVRRWSDLEMKAGRGDVLSSEDLDWLDRRRAALKECKDVRTLALQEAVK